MNTEQLTNYLRGKGVHEPTIGGLVRYIENRIAPGGFLTAVVSNNLKEAFARADTYNTISMKDIVAALYNYAPSDCWGSPEAVESWLGGK